LPWPQTAGPARSLACDNPQLAQAPPQGLVYPWGAGNPGVPWYYVRNEAVLGTPGAYNAPSFEQETTYVYDMQTSSNGHVYNYFNSDTYRVRVRQSSY
jgi:hypothetical protein